MNPASRSSFRPSWLLLLALLAPAALAQGNSVLTGVVIDGATLKPIENVVVTVTSPQLQGSREVVTDSAGLYRIPQLPAGTYAIRYEEPAAHKPYEQQNVPLKLATTVKVNVQLVPSELSIEIIVEPAVVVDVSESGTHTSVSSAFLDRVPLTLPTGKGAAARSWESVVEVAPGAQNDTFGVSIAGTTSPENGYQLDGMGVNDPGFALMGSPLTIDFIDEVKIMTGGYLPEYGRATGGVVTAVTKSGSNELHGSLFGNYTPGALVAPGNVIRQEAGTVSGRSSLWNLGDVGFEVGGPVLKDKLWFFAGVAPSFTRFAVERQLNAIQLDGSGNPLLDAEGNTVTAPIEGTDRRYFADQRSLQYIGKLTYNLSPDQNLSLTVSGTPTSSGGSGRFAFDDRVGVPEVGRVVGQYDALATTRIANAIDASAKWNSSYLESRLLFDVTLGYHRQDKATRAADGSRAGETSGLAGRPQTFWARTEGGQHSILEFENVANAAACDPGDGSGSLCPVLNYATGGPGFLNEITMDRLQAKAIATGLFSALGHHVAKAGIDAENIRFDQTKAYSGKVAYLEGDDGSYFIDFRQFGYLTGPDQYVIQDAQRASSVSQNLGLFLQDSWNVADLFLINAGLRFDTQVLQGGGQTAMVLGNQLSPRVGVVYDPTQKGHAKVFANYARYYESVPLDLVDRQFPGERQIISLKDASLCNPLDPVSAATTCMSDAARLEWRPASDASRYWGTTGGVPTIVDPDLKPQSTDEMVIGGELELPWLTGTRTGVTYTHRTQNTVIEDMSRDDGATYFIGNPGRGFAGDFPDPVRDYDAVTAFVNREFADGWLAQASYTWSSLRGNYEGLFRADTGQLDPNINSDFDLLTLLPNRVGPLPADRTHQIKVFAAKEFKVPIAPQLTVDLGLSYRGTSGGTSNYLGAHEVYGAGEAFILPRGSGPRLPWVHRIDGQLALSYRLGKQTLSVSADVFNLFNFQAVTAVDDNYTFSAALPIVGGTAADLDQVTDPEGNLLPESARNPNFGHATAYQSPRSVRFGAKLSF